MGPNLIVTGLARRARKESNLDSTSSLKSYKCHIDRILHAIPATEAAKNFQLGFQQRTRPFRAVVEHVLTATCRLQVTGINLPECGTISLVLDTTQLSGQQLSSAPYSLIVYPAQGLPSAYPLNLTGTTALWVVNYSAGKPRFAPATARFSIDANDTAQEPSSCSILLMRVETQGEYRKRSTPCSQANPKNVSHRLALPPLL